MAATTIDEYLAVAGCSKKTLLNRLVVAYRKGFTYEVVRVDENKLLIWYRSIASICVRYKRKPTSPVGRIDISELDKGKATITLTHKIVIAQQRLSVKAKKRSIKEDLDRTPGLSKRQKQDKEKQLIDKLHEYLSSIQQLLKASNPPTTGELDFFSQIEKYLNGQLAIDQVLPGLEQSSSPNKTQIS